MNKHMRLLLYGSNIWYFGEGMLGPLFAVFAQQIGGDIFAITWAWATYLVVTGVLYIIIGHLSDHKFNKAKIMVAGYGLNTILTFCYLLVSRPEHLFLLQAGLGLATAMASPTWLALYAEHQDRKHNGLQWGLAGGEGYIITGLAVIAGGLIVTLFSFKALFILMGTIEAIATIYLTELLRLQGASKQQLR